MCGTLSELPFFSEEFTFSQLFFVPEDSFDYGRRRTVSVFINRVETVQVPLPSLLSSTFISMDFLH